jgi:hypothetical protein
LDEIVKSSNNVQFWLGGSRGWEIVFPGWFLDDFESPLPGEEGRSVRTVFVFEVSPVSETAFISSNTPLPLFIRFYSVSFSFGVFSGRICRN